MEIRMNLTLLGTGSPESYVRRASSGYLVDVGDETLMFDCGGGSFDHLLQAGRMRTVERLSTPATADRPFSRRLHLFREMVGNLVDGLPKAL
jgi:hypothetical protein